MPAARSTRAYEIVIIIKIYIFTVQTAKASEQAR